MKVEVLIYAYLAICTAMIFFNVICIFVFRRKDKKLKKRSINFTKIIGKQINKEAVGKKHKRFMKRKLKKVHHMMAFDETLEKMYSEQPKEVRQYIISLKDVFVYLTHKYSKKNRMQAAYFPYIVNKYNIFKYDDEGIEQVIERLTRLVKDPNLYCRENAMQALYSIGNADSVVDALKIMDRAAFFHHIKMITDGLLSFAGNKEELDDKLWSSFERFTVLTKRSILDYFRFESDRHCEKMLRIMTDPKENQELRFSAIRYFAKYYYEPALELLYEFATNNSPIWEYRAITASALGNYPSEKTENILKMLLSDYNWHVRYNASDSLERLGVEYYDMLDILEGTDRYASEVLRYRFDRKKLTKTRRESV